MTKMPDITEEDCLAGEKEITVELRDGKTRTIKVRSLPWRTSIVVLQKAMTDPGSAAIHSLEHCLAGDDKEDHTLNSIIPVDLITISNVALTLSNGAGEAKKRVSAEQSHSGSETMKE